MTPLPAPLRSGLTLGVLAALVVVGLLWGWSAATAPLPGSDDGADGSCDPVTVEAGDRVRTEQVVVSVLNAGSREGLAGEVMDAFVERGFRTGASGNAPSGTEVARVQVWAADRRDPAVALVRSALRKPVPVVDTDVNAPGVVVVVGDRFGELVDGRNRVKARQDGEVCAP